MTTIEAARIATTAAQDAQPDARKVSALVWIVPLIAFWIAVGLAVL